MKSNSSKALVAFLAVSLSSSVAFAKPVTHAELHEIVKSCTQKFSDSIWLAITNSPADANNTLKFDFPYTPGPYEQSSTGTTVAIKISPAFSSLWKKSSNPTSTTMSRACTQTLTSSLESFQVSIDCSDSGSAIPTRRVKKLTLATLAPAGLPSVSYEKADLELTYDDAGSRTPDLDLIKKVRIEQPKLLGAAIPFTNLETNVTTKLTADTDSLNQCLTDALKDLL